MTECFALVWAETFSPKKPRGFALVFREPFFVVEAIKRPTRAELSFTLGGCGRQGLGRNKGVSQRLVRP